jgi:23S rRNA (guanine2445-N2)-methyltransferase / 23S rRNA (guanine2069-N7)-methyltransferase
MSRYRFFVTAPKHLESLLADELRALGMDEVAETRGGASFAGDLAAAYRVCLWSRVANRVLLPLAEFPAATPEELYDGVKQVPWEEQFGVSDRFAVEFHTSRSAITHTHFGALKVKDAVVDRFRERCGERPSVDTDNPDLRIDLYLLRDRATLSLDLAGDSLHRRGYRLVGAAAPLKENLAAAILLRAGWPQIAAAGGGLVDPMCGSGTLVIEAALLAADIAPGLLRERWGFLQWKKHHAAAWEALRAEALERRERGLERLPLLCGYDHNPEAIRIARENAERAGLADRLRFERRELAQASPPPDGIPGLVVANPPYGERLGGDPDLSALYARLGETLKANFSGWRAAVITGNPELGKQMGLRAGKMNTLYNGPIECRLLHFEITPENFVVERRFPAPLPPDARGEGAQAFANRLRKNQKHLGRWLRREGITCYRLYDADLPEYALAVDLYEGEKRWVHVQEYQAPASVDPRQARLRLREAIGVLLELLEIDEEQLFFKVRQQQKGSSQYERLAAGRRFHEVREDGLRFLVNFEDYLDTGLFLDHRDTRRLVGELADGRRFLNLFGYTGTATVYAARGGALATTTLDLSNTYLEWARRNLELNGFRGSSHRFVRADCTEWLAQGGDGGRYGLIFLDPPSFSTSKRMEGTLDIQRDHGSLIRNAARLLEPDGVLIFSNNLRRFRMDREALADLEVEEITRATLPKDFERNPKIHNCWRIRLRPGGDDGS